MGAAESRRVGLNFDQISLNSVGKHIDPRLFELFLSQNRVARNVYLSWSRLGDVGACSLAKALRTNACIRVLDLASNNIGDAGALALARAISFNQGLRLEELSLENNVITDVGAGQLVRWQECTARVCFRHLEFRVLL